MQPQDPVSNRQGDQPQQPQQQPQQPEWSFLTRGGGNVPPHERQAKTLDELLSLQYKHRLQELAQQSVFFILMQDTTTGQKIPDPEDHSRFIVFYGNNEWEEKVFIRHKITRTDYQKAEELFDNTDIDNIMDYYKFLASCFLKMSEEDFKRAEWGYLRMVIDACQFRTVRTLPKLSKGLYEYYHLGKAKLTEDEYNCIQTYRLWTGKAHTKPWEINGGIIYEEDLNMVLQMEELEVSGENFRAKKQQGASTGGDAAVGEDGVVHRKSTRVTNRR